MRFQHKFDPWWNQLWCFVVPSLYALYKYNDFWTGFFVLGRLELICERNNLGCVFSRQMMLNERNSLVFLVVFTSSFKWCMYLWYSREFLLVPPYLSGCLRWCICLHATWTVNSTAHIWGDRRYTVEGNPCESCFTALVAVGEGWHDWHHKYPYDYAASEGAVKLSRKFEGSYIPEVR